MASVRQAFGIALALALTSACGGGSDANETGGTITANPSGFVIRIVNMRFTPAALTVPPGTTITVVNADGMPHSVTSATATGAYAPGGVGGVSFDTGAFSTGQRTIQIPASAAVGTVIPFYCSTHLGTMTTPNGSITIDAAATAPPPTDGPDDPGPSTPGY